MNMFMNTSIRTILFLLAAGVVFISCENSTSSDDEEHSDPFGAVLILNGADLAIQDVGSTSFEYTDGNQLELTAGDETNTILIRWIDEDGERFTPHEDEGYSLRWVIGNEDVLDVEQHDEDSAWGFHLVGLNAGESTIVFELWHNDHRDFFTSAVQVEVLEAQN